MKLFRSALAAAILAHASGAFAAEIFSNNLESGASLKQIFSDVNPYGGVQVSLSSDFAHSGSQSIKITYPNNEAGVELRPSPFPATKSLYTRKYEYYAAGWEGNWPAGLKTSRYFTLPDCSLGPDGNGSAYMSEKLIWQSYTQDPNDLYARGLNNAVYDLDIIAAYPSTMLFGNGLPYIRTGHWYKYETWMVLNSAVDVPDGILQVWIDDQLVLNKTNLLWKSTARGVPNGVGWQCMWFGGNYTNGDFGPPSQPVNRYIDDMYLSTTLDRAGAPTPKVPTNLLIK